jgi:S-DNA-T family DNA segregation ATPase FtsK/SpoIIIE
MKVSTRPSASGRSRVSSVSSHRPYDIAGIGLLALALIVLVSLCTANSGILGGSLSKFFLFLFGKGAWAVPPLFLALGVCLLKGRSPIITHLFWGLCLMFVALLGAIAAPTGSDYFDPAAVSTTGGYLGAVVGWMLNTLLGAGKPIGLSALGLIGLTLSVDVPIRTMLQNTRMKAAALTPRMPERTIKAPKALKPAKPLPSPEEDEERIKPLKRGMRKPVVEDEPVTVSGAADTMVGGEDTVAAAPVTKAPRKAAVIRDLTEALPSEPDLSADTPTPKEGYELPPMNLLAEAIVQPKRAQAEMQKNIETLEGTLEQFGIDANVVEVATGPTVTRYEIQLGAGIRVNRITALADNIAMDLAASQVRVEAPIPGKAAIGVEVPNSAPTMVTLRELCEAKEFQNHPSRLYVALGKDVSGVNKYADLTKMPHLLIGGATNSGKSIGLATLITSLLVRNTPKEVRLVMIDPKRVELTLFDHIPHLMCPVIKDTSEAAGVLRAVWREMDRRYDLFSAEGVRNIDSWNSKASFQDKLPYIVVIIDELADLMIQHRAEVETVIVRLAQLARAVGIHMVLATQRPSVDVITGLIKANIPSRIAFSVASHIDSRTILDQKGAEALIGKGDMLYSPIDAMKPLRVQGCFVSEKEIDAICKFWRAQQQPEYVLNPVEESTHDPSKEAGDFGDEVDPFWEEAVRWVAERGQASTSMLQRKFSIGFQRASRLLDMMEERSIVGPRDGPRPREVLVNIMDVDALFGTAPRYDVGPTIGDGLDE